jgi:hypothetical protein
MENILDSNSSSNSDSNQHYNPSPDDEIIYNFAELVRNEFKEGETSIELIERIRDNKFYEDFVELNGELVNVTAEQAQRGGFIKNTFYLLRDSDIYSATIAKELLDWSMGQEFGPKIAHILLVPLAQIFKN